MGEYRNLGDKLPSFEEVARYIYFTETSQNFDPAKLDKANGQNRRVEGNELLSALFTE